MCGIGLIVSSVAIEGSVFSTKIASSGASSQQIVEPFHPDIENLCGALKRRGPDHTGGAILHVDSRKQHLQVWEGSHLDTALNRVPRDVQRFKCGTRNKEHEAVDMGKTNVSPSSNDNVAAWPSGPDMCSSARLDFIGTTLQLRGKHPVTQPLEDSAGNLLVYNGEIFDGLVVKSDENDGAVLVTTLRGCCGCNCHSSQLVSECRCADAVGHRSVPQVLSQLRGPWALIYWQAVSQTLWFGRDAIGRRSLLIHLPSANDLRLLLTSVAPDVREDKAGSFEYWHDLACGIYSIAFSTVDQGGTGVGAGGSSSEPNSSVEKATNLGSSQRILTGWAREHTWEDLRLRTMLAWERHVTPNPITAIEGFKPDQFCNSEQQDVSILGSKEGVNNYYIPLDRMARGKESSRDVELSDSNWQVNQRTLKHQAPVEQVLDVLRQAVRRRTVHIRQNWGSSQFCTKQTTNTTLNGGLQASAPVAVLFSGGVDSMILAALADQFVDSQCTIDLLNVSFDGDSAPDRTTAFAGVAELQAVFPLRRWRLVQIDAKWSDLQDYRVHLQSLICPSNTYMDLNIGTALWLAASGKGLVRSTPASESRYIMNSASDNKLESDRSTQHSDLSSHQHSGAFSESDSKTGGIEGEKYYVSSEARVLLVGSGADEQCGGYGRHRTKFRHGGWIALEAEMRLDFNRIWKRNLGRDDRCIADLGKEARFPFLDEDVISTLLSIPLSEVVDLQQPVGVGDKKILRQVAQALGLKGASSLPKRAIQFGSRIAQASNTRDFGSNRAANQASAGSATLKLQ